MPIRPNSIQVTNNRTNEVTYYPAKQKELAIHFESPYKFHYNKTMVDSIANRYNKDAKLHFPQMQFGSEKIVKNPNGVIDKFYYGEGGFGKVSTTPNGFQTYISDPSVYKTGGNLIPKHAFGDRIKARKEARNATKVEAVDPAKEYVPNEDFINRAYSDVDTHQTYFPGTNPETKFNFQQFDTDAATQASSSPVIRPTNIDDVDFDNIESLPEASYNINEAFNSFQNNSSQWGNGHANRAKYLKDKFGLGDGTTNSAEYQQFRNMINQKYTKLPTSNLKKDYNASRQALVKRNNLYNSFKNGNLGIANKAGVAFIAGNNIYYDNNRVFDGTIKAMRDATDLEKNNMAHFGIYDQIKNYKNKSR